MVVDGGVVVVDVAAAGATVAQKAVEAEAHAASGCPCDPAWCTRRRRGCER